MIGESGNSSGRKWYFQLRPGGCISVSRQKRENLNSVSGRGEKDARECRALKMSNLESLKGG